MVLKILVIGFSPIEIKWRKSISWSKLNITNLTV